VVSRDVSDIGEEISAAVQKGYEHFILVADNLNSYGKDKNITYIQLLDAVFKLDGRITVSLNNFSPVSSLPELERFLNILKPGKIKCINYSLQSGSDRLLKAMNRGYTRELFLSSARAILKRDPGISLRSDIMIGFPGETDEDFSQTLAMIQKVPFETINALLYNERPGTKASGLAGKVSEEVKRQRYRKITRAFHARTFKRWVNYFFKRDCLMLD
jgi:tRNA-2-methylthio-N6-dimethylallyladenosine synthase